MSIIRVVAFLAVAGQALPGAVLAEQIWAPPAEIAPKTQPNAAAPAQPPAAEAPKPEAKAPQSKEEKEKECKAQARAKGLRGKARRTFLTECENA